MDERVTIAITFILDSCSRAVKQVTTAGSVYTAINAILIVSRSTESVSRPGRDCVVKLARWKGGGYSLNRNLKRRDLFALHSLSPSSRSIQLLRSPQ